MRTVGRVVSVVAWSMSTAAAAVAGAPTGPTNLGGVCFKRFISPHFASITKKITYYMYNASVSSTQPSIRFSRP